MWLCLVILRLTWFSDELTRDSLLLGASIVLRVVVFLVTLPLAMRSPDGWRAGRRAVLGT